MRRLMWKFLIGYVTITLEGLYLEEFLTDIRKKCRIRSVKRTRYTMLEITVPARFREEIFLEAEKRSIRCAVIREDDAAHFSQMFFHKWWMPVTAILIVFCAVWLSGYCFRIDFIGNEKLSEFTLTALLEENGIASGMRKDQIDLLMLKNLLYREYPSIAYTEAVFDGTTLKIILEEGNEPPELLAADPCSVAAKKRGVILSLTVGEGMAAAEPGDIVESGDILIKGAYIKKEKPFLVHARGRAVAQVDYIGRAEISLANGLVRTGKTAVERDLEIGRMKIALRGNNPFELYEEDRRTEYTIPENMPAFLRITETTYYECIRGISDEIQKSAEAQIREQAYYSALMQVPAEAEILDFYSVITERGGKLTATATVTVKEDIGMNIPAVHDIENIEETGDT